MRTKIDDYMVLVAPTETELSEQVMLRVRAGWKPLGGVSVVATETDMWFTQAVVFEVETGRS